MSTEPRFERRQDRQRVAGPQLETARIEPARAARVGGAEVSQRRPQAVPLGGEVRHDLSDRRSPSVDRARSRARASGRGRCRAQQGAADARERVEDQLAGPAEELDQPRHEPGRLVRPVRLAGGVTELRRVGRREQRLGEVEPFLARQLVQRVRGVRRSPGVGHPPSLAEFLGRGPPGGRDAWRARATRHLECRHARQVHERAVRGTRSRLRAPGVAARRRGRWSIALADPGRNVRRRRDAGSSTRPRPGSASSPRRGRSCAGAPGRPAGTRRTVRSSARSARRCATCPMPSCARSSARRPATSSGCCPTSPRDCRLDPLRRGETSHPSAARRARSRGSSGSWGGWASADRWPWCSRTCIAPMPRPVRWSPS